jgi:hypothetical protein
MHLTPLKTSLPPSLKTSLPPSLPQNIPPSLPQNIPPHRLHKVVCALFVEDDKLEAWRSAALDYKQRPLNTLPLPPCRVQIKVVQRHVASSGKDLGEAWVQMSGCARRGVERRRA